MKGIIFCLALTTVGCNLYFDEDSDRRRHRDYYECQYNADCADGALCNRDTGFCEPAFTATCNVDEECGPGCYCNDSGQCAASEYCDATTPCSDGYECDDRDTCVPDDNYTHCDQYDNDEFGCSSTEPCYATYSGSNCTDPDGLACTDGDANCTCATYTFEDCNFGGCYTNDDCQPGEACNDLGICGAPSCSNDNECAAGSYCDEAASTCVTSGLCDAGCATGYTCEPARDTCVPEGDIDCSAYGESDCFAASTCAASYRGFNCTDPNNQPCTDGDANCTCATFVFDTCETL